MAIDDAGERIRIVNICMGRGVAMDTCAEILGVGSDVITAYLNFTGQEWPAGQEVRAANVAKATPPAAAKAEPKAAKRQPKKPATRWDGPDGERFRQMWEDGISGTVIGQAFGVTSGTVSYVARRLGLPGRAPVYRQRFRIPNGPAPVPVDQSELADVKTFLRRRGHVVYDATVDGGPEGQIRFNRFTISPEELVATAERLGFDASQERTA